MKKPHEIHVISNTHWDREWLNDFQETRLMLVEFFDRLLDVLEKEPGYDSYLLDSQAVPLEDYLELRPEKREILTKHVTEKRLYVGPWYTCPEAFCVNGESLVRNLLYGHRVARGFGHVMKVGYTPFSYGQPSQMPQIYAGFGIDTILFYHGVSHDDTPNEFWFEGSDGTRLFASQMSSGARYNFYHNIYRRIRYGARIDDREYEWGQGGLPFHLCGESHCMEHHLLLDPVTGFHDEYLKEAFRSLREAEIKTATTRFLAFMDGHDSSLADAATLRIIEAARPYAGKDIIVHGNLPDLMEKIKREARNLPVLRGERRVPKPMGARVHLYSDVLSCRTRMKRLNVHAETVLQRWAEPFAAFASTIGAEYPAAAIDLAWKTLLKCHAHDSIAGTGVDDIEQDMNYRLRQVVNISRGVKRRALQAIQVRINHSGAKPNDILLTVFNPSPYPRSEIVTATLDVPPNAFPALSLVECSTRSSVPVRVPVHVLTRHPHHAVVNHAGDATAMMTCERVRIQFEVYAVPGLGYTTYKLVACPCTLRGSLVTGNNSMANEFLHVWIMPDGTLHIEDVLTGEHFDGLHYFEDSGEAGHAWMHIEPARDSIVTTIGTPARVTLEEDTPFRARYRVEYTLQIPVGLDENGGDPWKRLDGGENNSRRTDERRPMTIVSDFTLERGARAVEVVTRFENTCRNHRLRVMFPTYLKAKNCHVESAFDVVEREVVFGRKSPWKDSKSPTFPMHRFVDVSDGKAGLAIVNDGLREYQVTPDEDRAIAITLMRAFEVSLTTVSKRWDIHPEMPGSQCFGAHEFRYRIVPHKGTWENAGLFHESDRLLLPLEPAQAGAHEGDLPRQFGFLQVAPTNVVLSALKRAENGDGYIVRLFNPAKAALQAVLEWAWPVARAELVTLEELPGGAILFRGRIVSVSLAPGKIVTVRVSFRKSKKKGMSSGARLEFREESE
ncbi:MAG TPA: glycoside hydrolase family 38 C-terminal domain-containing protein [Candidatus Hydrogenedentes bacterium]|nr:glycoside hydrolase family 38 C-terminal domain-containing protein [Candidatus Hydrogenedentota bacterium]